MKIILFFAIVNIALILNANAQLSNVPASESNEALGKLTATGLEYRIQICATKGQKGNIDAIKQKFNITEEVSEDSYNGWYQYTLGNFSTIKEAHDYLEKVKNDFSIKDAFVTTFFNGERTKSNTLLFLLDNPVEDNKQKRKRKKDK